MDRIALTNTRPLLLASTLPIVYFPHVYGLMSVPEPVKSFFFDFPVMALVIPFYMASARFYPLYLLAKLYDETGQKEKAVAMAKEVMEKEVKIKSTAIQEIQEEMRQLIEKSKAEILNKNNIQTDNNITPIYKVTKERAYRSVVLTDKFMLQKW